MSSPCVALTSLRDVLSNKQSRGAFGQGRMEAIIQGARTIMVGDADVVVSGGMENMTMTPYAMPAARSGFRMNDAVVKDLATQVSARLVSPLLTIGGCALVLGVALVALSTWSAAVVRGMRTDTMMSAGASTVRR